MSLAAFDRQRAALAIQATGPEKHVLLVLATRGDDQGRCTPGIARIMSDTGLSERTVQRAIMALKDAGHITRDERPGCGVIYTVHPRQCDTPVAETPPSHSRETPATVAPKQPRTPISFKKATLSQKRRASKSRFVLPPDIPSEPWADFDEMRKAIRKPMTLKAKNMAVTRLRKLAEAGWPPGDVLNHSTLNNYQGLFPPKDERNGRQQQPANDGLGTTVLSGLDALRILEQRAGH